MASKGMMAAIVIVIIAIGGVGAYVIMFNPFGPQTNPHEVAIVFATGGLGDKSFNDGCYAGAQLAETNLEISFVFSEPTAITDYPTMIRAYAAHAQYLDAYDLIICIGFDQAEALEAVAEDYPNQQFAIVDMFVDPGTYANVSSLLFNEHEGSALVGAIAGMTTTTDKIGFVGGMDIPLINKFAAGYRFGANYTNTDVNVTIAYTNDWVDTTAGQALADTMYADGNDIVFAAAGRSGLGVFTSAKDKDGDYTWGCMVIGVDSPQMYLGTADPEADPVVGPSLCITTMLKKVDVAVYNIIEDIVDEVFAGGVKMFTLANGGLDYEINAGLYTLSPAIITAVDALKAGIIAGTIVVPDALT